MKIAILSLYSGIIPRGVETWVREIATEFVKSNEDVLVFQGGDETGKVYNYQKIDVSINWNMRRGESYLRQLITWPYWEFLLLYFTLKSLPSLVKFKPDIVMPCNGESQSLLIKIASLIFGWKVVITGHAGIGAPDKWNLLMHPHVFVSPSKRGELWAKSLFFSKGVNIRHIPHGVDINKFSPRIKKAALDLPKPIYICVSSFDSFKRVNLAIDAVSNLEKGSLLMVGGDRGDSGIRKYAHKKLGSKRFIITKVDPAEIPSYYSASDVFTLPSESSEAFGIAYLEALASGLPVVATNDSLRREIVGDAGILVNPVNTKEYAKALQTATSTNWGNKPRNQAVRFSWEAVSKKYIELFYQLKNGK